MPFYNSTNESGDNLEEYRKKAATQDEKIASFFELNPDQMFTPWEVQSIVFSKPIPPITSVRRSMNTLTKAGILKKTDHLKEVGDYGRRSHAWKLNESYNKAIHIMHNMMSPENEKIIDKMDIGNWIDKGGQIQEIGPEMKDAPSEERKSENEPETKQGKLFDIAPIKSDARCSICNRPLTDPKSISRGKGPTCNGKCMEP